MKRAITYGTLAFVIAAAVVYWIASPVTDMGPEQYSGIKFCMVFFGGIAAVIAGVIADDS